MATAQMDTVIRHLRRAVLRQDGAGRTDGQLLGSFIDQKDEAAFEALVRRHGPMVFGVCRRVVGNHHDAEDAFQATFLVLACKASSVRPRERVANWLHGVALRTALKAKTMSAKRRGREKQVTEMPEPEAAQQGQWRDLQPLLDQELNGLPENYRLPILLCDLEGKTVREATEQLGWPQGSLAGRLARGRKLLAKRLASRGVVLSAASLAAVVSQNVVSAGVPTSLMGSTVKAATMIAAGQAAVAGVVPAKVAVLTEGAMRGMMLTKLSMAAVVGLVVLGLCGLGMGGFQALPAEEPKTTTTTTTTITVKTTSRGESAGPPFFNGKNLFGWQGLPGYWRVRDGAIVGAPADGVKAHTFLCSEKTYGDFELKFKVKRKGGIGNSGVQIRSRIDDRERFTVVGPQVEIDSANFRYPPGSLVTEPVVHPYVKAKAAAVASVWEDDHFNAMTIRCKGEWVRVTINEVEVLNSRFPSLPDEGIIAWQLHGGNGAEVPEEVVFKDIHFTDLGRKQTAGASHLFHDGLTGWVREGGYRKTWQIRDGEVIGTATDYLSSGFLLSPRAYSNFRLRFQYQLTAGANSGVAIRAQPGETDPLSHVPHHLEVQILDDDTYRETRGVQDCFTGALFWSSRSNVCLRPAHQARLEPVGAWNEMEIELRDQSLKVRVNDRLVQALDLDQLATSSGASPGLLRSSGRIGFQQHTGQVRFRNVLIEELP